tara:strand:+ start:8310 stop:9026 length:717 start_codon:yes stop_codon:yes gene_type:complete
MSEEGIDLSNSIIDPSNSDICEDEFSKLENEIDITNNDLDMVYKIQYSLSEKLSVQKKHLHDKKKELTIKRKRDVMDFDLKCMQMENERMERYLDILKRKHEIEISYVQEVFSHNKKIIDICNSNIDISYMSFPSIDAAYMEQIDSIFSVKSIPTEIEEKKSSGDKPVRPPPPPIPNKVVMSNVVKKNDSNTPARRQSLPVGLEGHLRHALETKFAHVNSQIQKDQKDHDDSGDDSWD